MRTERPHHCARALQRGQALTEAAVAGVVMVPLFLLVMILGKYQSIQQAVIDASRWLAFECTVRIDECVAFDVHPELADEMRGHHFARTDRGVLSSDVLEDHPADSERLALWVDRSNRPLIERFSDIGARVTPESFDAGLSVAAGSNSGRALGGLHTLSNLAGPGRFGLDIGGGLVRARAQTAVSRSVAADSFIGQLDSIRLRPGATTAVLTDAWNASGPYGGDPRSVEARVERGGRLPGGAEDAIDLAYMPMRAFIWTMVGLGLEGSGDKFDYHHVDVDLVPTDRLEAR